MKFDYLTIYRLVFTTNKWFVSTRWKWRKNWSFLLNYILEINCKIYRYQQIVTNTISYIILAIKLTIHETPRPNSIGVTEAGRGNFVTSHLQKSSMDDRKEKKGNIVENKVSEKKSMRISNVLPKLNFSAVSLSQASRLFSPLYVPPSRDFRPLFVVPVNSSVTPRFCKNLRFHRGYRAVLDNARAPAVHWHSRLQLQGMPLYGQRERSR